MHPSAIQFLVSGISNLGTDPEIVALSNRAMRGEIPTRITLTTRIHLEDTSRELLKCFRSDWRNTSAAVGMLGTEGGVKITRVMLALTQMAELDHGPHPLAMSENVFLAWRIMKSTHWYWGEKLNAEVWCPAFLSPVFMRNLVGTLRAMDSGDNDTGEGNIFKAFRTSCGYMTARMLHDIIYHVPRGGLQALLNVIETCKTEKVRRMIAKDVPHMVHGYIMGWKVIPSPDKSKFFVHRDLPFRAWKKAVHSIYTMSDLPTVVKLMQVCKKTGVWSNEDDMILTMMCRVAEGGTREKATGFLGSS